MVCPSQETLRTLLEGEIPESTVGELADHVIACEHCAQALATLKVQDPLLEMVHSLKGSRLVGHKNPEVEHLVARVCRLLATTAPGDAPNTPVGGDTLRDACPPIVRPSIPGYEILAFMDYGGMGEVWKARHLALDKVMALKLCKGEKVSAIMLARFRQEIKAVGRLNHAHIVQAHDAGTTDDGVPYLAMEFLEGNDLATLVKRQGRLPVVDACAYLRQAALGLQHAHEQSMVHRDLKPANLLLTTGGIVKILDLGLARLREPAPDFEAKDGAKAVNADSMSSPSVMGTAEYMAPEQWQDAHAVDIRADLYGLGCTLYHLLAGKPPFEGNMLQQRAAHLEETPRPIRQLRPDVPQSLSNLVDRLLAKNPKERPSTPAEVATALERFIPQPFVQRSFWAQWVGVVAFLAFALLAGGITYVVTDRGTVTVKTDDVDVEVVVKQNGKIIVIVDKKSGKEFTLRSGTYDLELQKGKDGLRLSTSHFVLKRGDTKIVEVYLEKPGWVAKKPLLYPTASCMAGVANGQAYILGGMAGNVSFSNVQSYDPAKDEWHTRTPFPRIDDGDPGRYNGSLGVLGGKFHVIGGWRHFENSAKKRQGLPTRTLLIYDPAKDRKGSANPDAWSTGKPLPILSGGSLAGVISEKLYVLTGADGSSGWHKSFHVYDPGTGQWSKLKSPPHSHVGGAGAVIDGKFYAIGGQDEQGVVRPHVDVYNAATDKWTTRKPMPKSRTGSGCAVADGRLYVVGGQDAAGKMLDTAEVYDPIADTWSALPSLPSPRSSLAVVAVGRTLYAIGGSDGATTLPTVAALDLATLWPTRK